MEEVETETPETFELTDTQRFVKMIAGVGAGWIAKELTEKAVVSAVKWWRGRSTESTAE